MLNLGKPMSIHDLGRRRLVLTAHFQRIYPTILEERLCHLRHHAKPSDTFRQAPGLVGGASKPARRRPLVAARSAQPKWAIARPADSAESPFRELELMELWDGTGKTRVRQHVNPLRRDFQTPAAAPDWSAVFADPSLPLALDIGSGYGRFLLLLQRTNPTQQVNYLGLEIRRTLVDRSNEWASRLGLRSRVHYIFANATVSLATLLVTYPGPVTDVFIQFPDPHFKRRHHKRRVVQPQLVAALKEIMPSGGRLLLQSDVEEVAVAMRNMFERYGGEAFELAPQHREEGAVFFSGRPAGQGPVGEVLVQDAGPGQETGPFGGGSAKPVRTAVTVEGATEAAATAATEAVAAAAGPMVSARDPLLNSATYHVLDAAGDAAPAAAAAPNYAAAAAGAARHAMAAAAAATAAVRQAEQAAVAAAADDDEGPVPDRVGNDSGTSTTAATAASTSTSLYDTSADRGGEGESSDGESDDGGGGGDGDADPDADISQMVSKWALGGWLVNNPVGSPTEREHYVEQQGLPVYRVALVRK